MRERVLRHHVGARHARVVGSRGGRSLPHRLQLLALELDLQRQRHERPRGAVGEEAHLRAAQREAEAQRVAVQLARVLRRNPGEGRALREPRWRFKSERPPSAQGIEKHMKCN